MAEKQCSCTYFFYDCPEAARLWSEALTCTLNDRPNEALLRFKAYRWHKRRAFKDDLEATC